MDNWVNFWKKLNNFEKLCKIVDELPELWKNMENFNKIMVNFR